MHSEVDFLEAQVQQAQGRKQELLQRRVPELCAELAGLQVGRHVRKRPAVLKRGDLPRDIASLCLCCSVKRCGSVGPSRCQGCYT